MVLANPIHVRTHNTVCTFVVCYTCMHVRHGACMHHACNKASCTFGIGQN